MSEASPALDEAFDRMAASGFELPNGFVYHGPMACGALAALGCDDDIDRWARRLANPGAAVAPVVAGPFDWRDALGDYRRLPEWIGYFQVEIADQGWSSVVGAWVPPLMPALSVLLYHGAIRTAHAVRAIDAADTEPRRAELARALGYWAARYRPGEAVAGPIESDDPDIRLAVATVAAEAARYYLARPTIFNLHGVTGAMAVDLLADHLSPAARSAALAQVRAEHAAMYQRTDPVTDVRVAGIDDDALARAATASLDPHQVKLVEACRRGLQRTGDLAFAAAAELVTRRRAR